MTGGGLCVGKGWPGGLRGTLSAYGPPVCATVTRCRFRVGHAHTITGVHTADAVHLPVSGNGGMAGGRVGGRRTAAHGRRGHWWVCGSPLTWQRMTKSSRKALLPGSAPLTTAPLTLRPFQSIPSHPHAIMLTPHADAGGKVVREDT
jgi:hypothetical protein